MAGDSQVVLKRQREEVEEQQETPTLTLDAEKQQQQQQQQTLNIKRQKSSSSSSSSSPYNDILSFLDEEEEKLIHQDLSSLITTLQQELSPANSEFESSEVASAASEEKVDDRERVLRHLLEASDDELGLPSRDEGANSVSESSPFPVNAGDDAKGLTLTNLTALDNGLWELEDEAANYYALLQSELFTERHELGDAY